MGSRVATQVGERKKSSLPRLAILLALLATLVAVAVPLNARFAASSQIRRHIQDGIRLYQSGDTDKAISEWRTALREDPTRPEPYRLLSEALIGKGMPQEAVPLLEHLQKIAPKMEHIYCQLAEAHALTATGTIAMDSAKAAVEKEPECSRAHALYGIQLGNRAEHAKAVSELSRATLLDPDNEKIALSLAQAQLNAADLEGVEKTVQPIISRNPGLARGHYLLGWSYSRRTPTPANLEKAITAFRRAFELNTEMTDIPAELGRLGILAGDYKGAVVHLEQAWKDTPHTPDVAFNLAKAYRSLGDSAKAARMSAEFKRLSDLETRSNALQKRLAINPNDVESAIELADLETSKQNWEDAASLIQALLKVRPDDPRLLKSALRLNQGIGDSEGVKYFSERLANQQEKASKPTK